MIDGREPVQAPYVPMLDVFNTGDARQDWPLGCQSTRLGPICSVERRSGRF